MSTFFENLYHIDVNDKVEKKNDLSYLSWAYAYAEVMKKYPDMTYEIERFGEDKKPYLFDKDLGYMVFTRVTIEGITKEMWLPVMDSSNKAMLDVPYNYKVKRWDKVKKQWSIQEKTCEKATMFDINKTIMRCLVKNIGMFGLGLYIYAGEDLPEENLLSMVTKAENTLKQMGVDIEEKSFVDYVRDHNNGLCGTDTMTDKELLNYINVLNGIIQNKKSKANK